MSPAEEVMLGRLWVCFVSFCIFASTLSAQLVFDPPATYPSGEGAEALSVDLNRDGLTDLVQTYQAGEAYLAVLMANGDGSFRGPFTYNFFYAFSSLIAGDFNADGHMDLASTGCGMRTCFIQILHGDSNGAFPTQSVVAQGTFRFLTSGDFNNDGRTDLAALHADDFYSRGLSIFLDAGDGAYTRRDMTVPVFLENNPEYPPGQNWVSNLVAGDFNGDGKIDLAYENHCGGCAIPQETLVLLWNDGTANFTPQRATLSSNGAYATSTGVLNLKSLDVDMDGRSDLFWLYSGCHTPCRGVVVYYSDGDGKFSFASVSNNYHVRSASITDLDNDGLMDIAVTSRDPYATSPRKGVFIYRGTGRRAIDPNPTVLHSSGAPSTSPVSLVTGYFDNNSTKDVAVVTANMWEIFLNRTSPAGNCAYPASPGINFCLPGTSNPSTTVRIQGAYHPRGYPFARMEVWIDGAKHANYFNDRVDVNVSLLPGTHTITLVGVDVTGHVMKSDRSVTVGMGEGGCTAPLTAGVKICTPAPDAIVESPVRITAAATAPLGRSVVAMRIYVDNTDVYTVHAASVDASITMSGGRHFLAVVAYNSDGTASKATQYVTVGAGTGACSVPSTANTVAICLPTEGSSNASPVRVTAAANVTGFTGMRLYVDDQDVYFTRANQVDAALSLSAGSHRLVVVAYNNSGGAFVASRNFSISGGSTATCNSPSTTPAINICSPGQGSTVGSPVTVSAKVRWDGNTVTHVRVYVDNVAKYDAPNPANNAIHTQIALPAGAHRMVIVAWNSSGAAITAERTFTVQ